MVSDIVRESYR